MKSVHLAWMTIKNLHDQYVAPFAKDALKRSLALLFLVALASCGSDQSEVDDERLITGISQTTTSTEFGKPASSEEVAASGKELESYFNGRYASNPTALMGVQALSEKQFATKAIAASNVPTNVFRFYNTNTGTHFFTISATERDYVRNNLPFFAYEGGAFSTYTAADPALSPVYRFYNRISGTHFYTISETEKDHVVATWPTIFNFEGIAWYASRVLDTGMVPIYRLFNRRTGTHFYTASATERDHITASMDWFTFEGIAYYVRQVAPPQPTCTPPSCYPPATRPAQTSSQNVFWMRTDSNRYHYLTGNQLIYSTPSAVTPFVSSYDRSITFGFEGNSFFVKPGVSLPPVYHTDYVQQNLVDSNSEFTIGLNKYASRHGGTVPALQIETVGRGCNTSKGAFYLHELETAADGTLTKFAADFNYVCDGADGANGVVRFNSNVPSVLSQVFAVAGSDFAVQEGRDFSLRGDLSWSPSSKIRTARWTQISGPALDLSQCEQLTCQTYAPLMPAGAQTATLRLTVETESGLVASDTVNVEIRSNLEKQTLVEVWGEGRASTAVGQDLRMNDMSAHMQIAALLSLGSIYPNQTSERVHVIAKGRTQDGDQLITGVDMAFMSKAGEALVPGEYADTGTGGGFEPFPNSASVHVSADGAGCGHNQASMYVGDIQRDAPDYGNISSLSIFAETLCTDGGLIDEPTFTRLWINHQPANIPVAHISGATQSTAGQQITLSSSASFARKGEIVNKTWRIVFSTAEIGISDSDSDSLTLSIGTNSPSGSKAVVALEVIDSSGDIGTTLHVINVP